MSTPQLLSAAPERLCPRCGVRMQVISMTPSSYNYVCSRHDEGPFYLNVHHSFQVNEDGTIKEALDRNRRPSVIRSSR